MEKNYSDQELKQLHDTLYDIVAEIKRVCDKCGIAYFITGGTAIGAYFWEGIIPWDDDVDLGMTRRNYEKFLQVAPDELGEDYYLQWAHTDEHVPFYFAKVRKRHTLFCENQFKSVDMHQGIFVDIFPFDQIPESHSLEMFQYKLMNFFNGCMIAKEIWQYDRFGKCEVEEPRRISWISCLVIRLFTCLPKRMLFGLVKWSQTLFNRSAHVYCKNVATPTERLKVEEAEHPQLLKLGPLMVSAPADLEAYLHAHYPVLKKDIPEEQRINHRPDHLVFDTRIQNQD